MDIQASILTGDVNILVLIQWSSQKDNDLNISQLLEY